MDSKTVSNGILRALAVVLGLALAVLFFYNIRSVVAYIAIAAVIALIGRPVVLFLERRLKLRNALAAVLTMCVFLALIFGLASLFVPLILKQSENLSLLNVDQLQKNVQSLYTEVASYLNLYQIDIQTTVNKSYILSKIDYASIPNAVNSVISGLGNFSIGLFSVLFISFFFLKDSHLLEKGFLIFVPEGKAQHWKRSSKKIKHLLSRYFMGLILQIFIIFIIYTVGLLFNSVENAFVIALLCALLNLIPYIGPLIGAFLMVILAMTSHLGDSFSGVVLPKVCWILVVFAIGQLVDNLVSQPVIFSKSVKSHPLEVFLVILIAGILFGIVGLIVAIPVYTATKVILKEFLSENSIVKKLTKNI